jgi:hypothetical protein
MSAKVMNKNGESEKNRIIMPTFAHRLRKRQNTNKQT